MRSKFSAEDLEARRKEAIDFLYWGSLPQDIADSLGMIRNTIYAWKAK